MCISDFVTLQDEGYLSYCPSVNACPWMTDITPDRLTPLLEETARYRKEFQWLVRKTHPTPAMEPMLSPP